MKRLLSIFLSIILMLSCVLFLSCNDENKASESFSNDEQISTSESQTETSATRKKYDYNLDNYIFLPDVEKISIDFKLDYIQRVIDQLILNDAIKSFIKEDGYIVKEGDIVNVTYKGFFIDEYGSIKLDDEGNEVAFQGGSGTSNCYIGAQQFIKDFEIGLIGLEVGKEGQFKATFPENYGVTELNGVTVIFKAIVNKVAKPSEYNAELVNEYYGTNYKSVEEFEQSLAKSYINDVIRRRFINECLAFGYPSTEKELWERKISQEYFEIYLKHLGYSSRDEYIKSVMKEEMAYYSYARKHEITVNGTTSDDYEEYESALFELVKADIASRVTVNKIPVSYTSVTKGGSLFN